MMHGNGQSSVPPGFRFHPTDEELLHYYLRKKVAFEPIDLDVIRDVDLNKLEPWDLKERCRIGNGPQNEWYFFSRKDKKYPTGTRTNRATAAGFWKATGRDKAIHLHCNSKRIGMRKTLVFYIGRAPNGQKTDWIMHEYRLDDHDQYHYSHDIQEEGWVVCRVFKKKTFHRGFNTSQEEQHHQQHLHSHFKPQLDHINSTPMPWGTFPFSFDNSMHLPQLLSTESVAGPTPFMPLPPPQPHAPSTEPECPQTNLILHERFDGDWSMIDKLLASHQNLSQLFQDRSGGGHVDIGGGSLVHRLPMQYGGGGCDGHDHLLRLSK